MPNPNFGEDIFTDVLCSRGTFNFNFIGTFILIDMFIIFVLM